MTRPTGVEQLRDVQRSLAAAPENVRAQALAKVSEAIPDLWEGPLNMSATTTLARRVILAGAGHSITPEKITLIAANTLAPLSGGLVPGTQWHGAEFGATRRRIDVTYKGKTRRQLIGNNFPQRRSAGIHAYRIAKMNGPKLVAAYVVGAVKGLTMGNPDMETS